MKPVQTTSNKVKQSISILEKSDYYSCQKEI